MSALQKYKELAARLETENKALKEENERLKKGRAQTIPTGIKAGDVDAVMQEAAKRLVKEYINLAYDPFARPLLLSYIEEALHLAFEQGAGLKE